MSLGSWSPLASSLLSPVASCPPVSLAADFSLPSSSGASRVSHSSPDVSAGLASSAAAWGVHSAGPRVSFTNCSGTSGASFDFLDTPLHYRIGSRRHDPCIFLPLFDSLASVSIEVIESFSQFLDGPVSSSSFIAMLLEDMTSL